MFSGVDARESANKLIKLGLFGIGKCHCFPLLWFGDSCFEWVLENIKCVICPDVTQCGWGNIRIQELANSFCCCWMAVISKVMCLLQQKQQHFMNTIFKIQDYYLIKETKTWLNVDYTMTHIVYFKSQRTVIQNTKVASLVTLLSVL